MSSEPAETTDPEDSESPTAQVATKYSYYVLGTLVLVYVFNFIDRQILSILAEDIKRDLDLTDADIGFLYGAAFAVFYAVFGIPLGRLADVWRRTKLISVGLAFWSVMTALSGTARSFTTLTVFRFGVGVGEASASPAAFSMLSDYFPQRLRATAISIYSSGVYIGAGLGIFLGGWIVDTWNGWYPEGGPFGLVGWHAAYFAVGLPGIVMAVWVWTMREPVRGAMDGMPETAPHPSPFGEFGRELIAVCPPLTLLSLALNGAGTRGLLVNLVAAAAIAGGAYELIQLIGTPQQWIFLGIGTYSAFSWAQGLALRDPPTFAMIFKSPTLLFAGLGFSMCAFVSYGIGFWGAPYFFRTYSLSATEVGVFLGLSAAVGGWLGVTSGGLLSDRLKARTPKARLLIGFVTIVLSIPLTVALLYAPNLYAAYAFNFLLSITAALWPGIAATTVTELVLPRMRALAAAFYIMMVTFIGLALGPYTIGQLSDFFASGGMSNEDALRRGMLLALGPYAIAFVALFLASRGIGRAQSSLIDRARSAGEPI